jgi:hypothetical protein
VGSGAAIPLVLQTNVMSYGGSGVTISVPAPSANGKAKANGKACGCDCGGTCQTKKPGQVATMSNGEPDFTKMTAAQKIAWHKSRWDRILG